MALAEDTAFDGRTARAVRTRDAVVEAFLELLDEGVLRPTARRVAERAGVSLRSVYVRFEDLDSLAVAAAQRQWERIAPLITPIDEGLALPQRLKAFVARRCTVLETVMPVRRAAQLQEPFSPALADLLTTARSIARSEVEGVFRRELAQRRGATRERLLDALDLACGSMAWEALRHHRGLEPDRARRVVVETMTALFEHRPHAHRRSS